MNEVRFDFSGARVLVTGGSGGIGLGIARSFVLEALEATGTSLRVAVMTTSFSRYRIQFIGRGGRVLREVVTPDAHYAFTGDEGYVCAKVIESNGAVAWTQPVGVGPRAPQ